MPNAQVPNSSASLRARAGHIGVLALFGAACSLSPLTARLPPATNQGDRVDTTQAEAMLRLLEGVSTGRACEAAASAVAETEGTALILAQMNLMRRVNLDQYSLLLNSLGSSVPPELTPVDSSERATRGVAGLRDNVWPVLRWGVDHTELLRRRLAAIEELDLADRARRRARQYLPREVDLTTARFFVVMGGRAGAAALSGERVYVDLLLLSFLEDRTGRSYDPEVDLLGFFAHELHHVGYSKLLADHRRTLDLRQPSEDLAFGLLGSLVAEGSATYLVSGERDRARAVESDSGLAEMGHTARERLLLLEGVLEALRAGEIQSQEALDRASPFLLGSGTHLLGLTLLHRIDLVSGLETVLRIVSDPRRLLAEYQAALGTGALGPDDHRFPEGLATWAAAIGERPTPNP